MNNIVTEPSATDKKIAQSNNRKYNIVLPDGRQTTWTQDQINAKGEELVQKYPKAQVYGYMPYEPGVEYNDNYTYNISLGDGRQTNWSKKQWDEKGKELLAKYPDAKVSVVDPTDLVMEYRREQKDAIEKRIEELSNNPVTQNALAWEQYRKTQREIAGHSISGAGPIKTSKQLDEEITKDKQYQTWSKTTGEELREARLELAQNDFYQEECRDKAAYFEKLADECAYDKNDPQNESDKKNYGYAEKLNMDTAKTYVRPFASEDDHKLNVFVRNAAAGAKDTVTDKDWYSMGITELARDSHILRIFRRLEDKGLNLGEMSEEDYDRELTPGEKALVFAFLNNADAQAERARTLGYGYNAGVTATDSITYMAQFFIAGGIASGASKLLGKAGASGLARFLARGLSRKGSQMAIGNAVRSGAVEATERLGLKLGSGATGRTVAGKVVKAAGNVAEGVYKYGVRPIEKGLWVTAIAPSTYVNLTNAQLEFGEDGKTTKLNDAFWPSIADSLIENWSEMVGEGVQDLTGLIGKGIGAVGKKTLGKTTFGQWGRWMLDKNGVKVALGEGGFNGFFGEMAEEWIGNAARVGMGLMSKEEFKDFASLENQVEMAAAFAPMSLMGLAGNAVATGMQAKEYEKISKQFENVLANQGYTREEIDDLMHKKFATQDDIKEALEPVLQTFVRNAHNGKVSMEDYRTVLEFANASAQNEVLNSARALERERMRQSEAESISQQLGGTPTERTDENGATSVHYANDGKGQFSHMIDTELPNGETVQVESVTVVTDDKGNQSYFIGSTGTQVMLKDAQSGEIHFMDQSDYNEKIDSGELTSQTSTLTNYLDERVRQKIEIEEKAREDKAHNTNRALLYRRFEEDPSINLGTEENPLAGQIIAVEADGVVVDFGSEVELNGIKKRMHKISYEQAARAAGVQLVTEKEAKRVAKEIERQEKQKAQLKVINTHLANKSFIHNGQNYTFVREITTPDSKEMVNVIAMDEDGVVEEVSVRWDSLLDQALSEQKKAQMQAESEAAVANQSSEQSAEDGVLRDFRGNEIPLDDEGKVDKKAFKKKDAEAYYRWNDERRGGNVDDSMQSLQADINERNTRIGQIDKALTSETDPDVRDNLYDEKKALLEEVRDLTAIYDKYAQNAQSRIAEENFAKALGDVVRKLATASTDAQLNKLQEIKRKLVREYYAKKYTVKERTEIDYRIEDIQEALADADVPVTVTCYADVAGLLESRRIPRSDIDSVLDKLGDVEISRRFYGSSLAVKGFKAKGEVFILADSFEGVGGVTSKITARATYFHERQHILNRLDGSLVRAILGRYGADKSALYGALEKLIGPNAASIYKGYDAVVLADEVSAFTMERVNTDEEWERYLEKAGLDKEYIETIKKYLNGKDSNDFNEGRQQRPSYDNGSERADGSADGTDSQGTSGDEHNAGVQPRNGADGKGNGTNDEHTVSKEDSKVINTSYLDPRKMSDEEKQMRGALLLKAKQITVEENSIVATEELSARKAAEKWWAENNPEPLYYETEVGEVEINKNSIKDSLAHRYSQAKLDAITGLADGFENAVYLGTMPDSRERGVLDHYFAFPIIYKDEVCYVFCRALQDANVNRLYVHEVFVADKIKKGDTLQTAASKPHGGISLYKDILANVLDLSFSLHPTTQMEESVPLDDSRRPTMSDNQPTSLGINSSERNSSTDKGSESSEETKTLEGKIAEEESKVDTNPSEAQKEAGNYRKGHIQVGPFDITIENPKGSVRSGVDAHGNKWENVMNNTYGYIRGTEGVDGDHIDVFLSDNPSEGKVYVVDQVNPETGEFDEHKVMYGFNSEEEARKAYLANYSKGWKGLGNITEVSKEDFEKWIDSSHRKTKPFAEYQGVNAQQKKQNKPAERTESAPKPIGEGVFGAIYDQFKGKAREAIDFLKQIKTGEAIGALYHKDVGDIDLVWGNEGTGHSDGYGLAKLVKYHPEVVDNLQEIINSMHITARSNNRINLESDTHKAAIRLEWDGVKKNWLLTAYEKGETSAEGKTTDTSNTLLGGDTALSQTEETPSSTGKVNNQSSEKQANASEKIEDVGEKIGGARKDLAMERIELYKRMSQEERDKEMDTPDKVLSIAQIKNYVAKGKMSAEDGAQLAALNQVCKSSFYVMGDRYVEAVKNWSEGKPLGIEAIDAYFNEKVEGENTQYDLDFEEQKRKEDELYKEMLDASAETRKALTAAYGELTKASRRETALIEAKRRWRYYKDILKTYTDLHYPSVPRNLGGAFIYAGALGKYYVLSSITAKRGYVFSTYKEALEYLDKKHPALEAKTKEDGAIGKGKAEDHLYVGKSSSGWYIIKSRSIPGNIALNNMTFTSKSGAEEYLASNRETLASKEAALAGRLMGTNIGSVERVGKDWRQGKDITADEFREAFGFRGVEFGNYVTQLERADYLNKTYDAIMDFCESLGISPKAFSLNGELGFAFGARGSGAYAAHYEPKKIVINLTKTQGVGSLAHEWWHALDNYLVRSATGEQLSYVTEGGDVQRAELRDAFQSFVKEMRTLPYRRCSIGSGDYWGKTIEMTARVFQVYMHRRLAEQGIVSPILTRDDVLYEEGGETLPMPSNEEMNILKPYLDHIFDVLQERVDEQTGNVVLFQVGDDNESELKGERRLAYESARMMLSNAGIPVEEMSEEAINQLAEMYEPRQAYMHAVMNNVDSALSALKSMSEGTEEVKNAMHRDDLSQYGGTNEITFIWGKPGNAEKEYKGGSGISHILAKHGKSTLIKLIEVIAEGDVKRYVEGNKTVILEKDGYEAVLTLTRFGDKESWLLSGWNTNRDEEKEQTGENGEVSATSIPTQESPTFSRADLGAVVSDAKVRKEIENTIMTEVDDAQFHKEKSERADWLDKYVFSINYLFGDDKKAVRKEMVEKINQARREAKELYKNILSGNFNDVTLRQINDYIDNATNANRFYRPVSQRLPERALLSLRKGERTSSVDALFSRICESAVPAYERTRASGRRAIEARKEELLEAWAKATGNWHEGIKDFTSKTTPIDEGTDSKVFLSDDGSSVIKASKGKFDNRKFPSDIDYVNLFNAIFPSSAYRILGYGRMDGKFVRFLEQPLVDFSTATPLTAEERVKYMGRWGFTPRNEERTIFSNGKFIVSDLQRGNIVRDANGNVRVIDADVKLHTKDMGGEYSYPPVEMDTEAPELMTVYHGSGARFDKFDHSHMGEGEGSQVYGWGSYVTEVEGIGRTYAANNAKTLFAQYVLQVSAEKMRNAMADGRKTFEEAKREVQERLRPEYEKLKALNDSIYGAFIADYEKLERLTEDELKVGNLYTVEIPNNNGENYLEWDKPLTDSQYDNIQKGLVHLMESQILPSRLKEVMLQQNNGWAPVINIGKGDTGKLVYETLKEKLTDKYASKFLNSLGYVGIKYPAQYRSGGREDGASNYVIFNDSDLEIKDRVDFLRDGKTVYGMTLGDRILLNEERLNPNTPVHEYTHIWDRAVSRNNPELWSRGVELMKQTSLWKTVSEDANYADLDENGIASEVHSRLVGEKGEETLNAMSKEVLEGNGGIFDTAAKMSVIDRLRSWLKEFWYWVKNTMTPWSREEASMVGLNEFVNMPMADLARETRIGEDEVRFSVEDIANMETPILKSKGTFKNLKEAEQWAKENLQGREYRNRYTNDLITISGHSISEMLNPKSTQKINEQVHLAALQSVPDFIKTGIPAEIHSDTHGRGYDVMRLYNAIEIDKDTYRVKSTIKKLREGDKYYTYEMQEMEIIGGTQSPAVGLDGYSRPQTHNSISDELIEERRANRELDGQSPVATNSSINSITGAKLLKGVKKTNSDEYILPEIEGLAGYMKLSAEYDRDVLSNMYSEEEGATFRVVEDKDTLDRLNNEPTIKVYRAMQLWNGVLYPPMAGKVNGKWQHGIALDELGTVWEESEERPELVDEKGYFKLDKGNSKSLKARYNPYFHTSLTPLNDQFSSAQDRPELVTVEVEVPVSELTSGYKANKAKDAVGKVEWKAGVIQGKLTGKRTVILSRWDRPMRIVPDSEVADVIVDMFKDKKITMPSNVVTPSLRVELEKRGVPFVETDNQGKSIKKGSDVRFDVSEHRVYYNPRASITPVRGEWTKAKILSRLKDLRGCLKGVSMAAKLISEFDSPEELAEHMFYHGTVYGGGALKPSITMSDSEVERIGGGGYGQKYWGISVTKDKRIASNFSGTSRGVHIYPIILAKYAKVKEMPNLQDAADLEDCITELWAEGVDAVWIGNKDAGEQELCVLNPHAIVNIDTPEFYKVFGIGTEKNPLRLIDKEGIERLYASAKRFEAAKTAMPRKPLKPSRFDDSGVRKSDTQYEKELSDYQSRMREYENSTEYKTWEEERRLAERDIRFDVSDGYTAEEQSIIDKAKEDGTYMKAPNGKATNLNERQWAQVRTKAFKAWFGDWEKASRIEKLRGSEDVKVEYKGEYPLNSDAAQDWIKNNLRGEYTIEDTKEVVSITRIGAEEVTSHSRYDEAHLKSISAIPEILKNAIFLEEADNVKGNGKFDGYRYYAVGLDIDGELYTAKVVVGVKQGKRYYDHRLTQIEKGTLIDNIGALSTTLDAKKNAIDFTTEGNASLPPYIAGKDTKLLSILKNDASKVVDENGEPKVVYHGTDSFGFTVFDRDKSDDARSLFFTDNENVATGYANAKAEFNEFLLETGAQHESELSTERGDVYDLYLNMRKPAVIDAEGNEWNEVTVGVHWKLNGRDDETFRNIVERLNENGFGTYCYINTKGKYEFDYDSTIDALEDIFDVEEREEIEDKEGINFINICDYLVPEIDFDGSCNIVTNTRTINDLAERGGYDGVVFNNIMDSASSKYAEPSAVYALFDANRIKSATDNVGNFSAENDDIRFQVGDFRDGLTNEDEVYDAMAEAFEGNYGAANKLVVSLEKYYKGTIRSASYLAGATMRRDNMLPFPGRKYAGKDGEYHHIMFEDENGETFVVAVPFEDADKVREMVENGELDDVRFDVGDIRKVNDIFNRELKSLTVENANNKILYLGMPSDILRSVGIRNNPLKLYGNKIIKKMTKHGFELSDISNLPVAVADPIAIFKGVHEDSYAVLTELKFGDNNFLVTLSIGKGNDVDFNIISSVYDKTNEGVMGWIEKGKGLYYNKEKMLDYLRISAPIAEAQSNQAPSSATKIVETFDNPTLPENNDVRFDVSAIEGKSTSELNREFDRALDLQKVGNLPSGYIYKLGYPSPILRSTGFPYAPIELAPSHLTEKMEDAKHPFGYDDVKGLVNALQYPMAVFAYGDKGKAQNVIIKLTRDGKNFVVGVHFNQMPRGIMVSDIRGLFPKDNAQWLNWISQSKALYLDKAEIQALIDQQRTNLAEVEYLDLDSVAKVVKNFDNPIVPEENLYRVAPEYEDKQALRDIYTNGLPSSMDSTLLDIDDELSEDVRWAIAKAAADNGFDFVKATADYLAGADIEEVRPQLERVREMMRKDIGDGQAITLEDVQWALYQSAHKGENSLFDYISRMSKAEALGHTPQDNELLDKVDDGTRFSISEEMEARSATDMYNRASGYWRNRIKEGLVDMNESVNDLVDAIEKQSGQKADSFEDIRLALNQQSSCGLHDMNRYTSDYLEPMWRAIKSAMKNTGLSYDDISRYVILKHALERNIVFARRDARNDYKEEYAKLIAGIGLDKKEVENRRKQAIVDGDKEGIAKCDEELVTLDNEVVRLQSEMQTHLEAVEKGTDEKFLEYRKRDYSGLTSMYSEYPGLMPKESYASEVEYEQEARRVRTPMFDKVSDMENAAKAEVTAVEAKDPSAITELWAKVNAATKATLTSQYRSNMLTKEQYESVRDQFQYYVPLRGFTDVTAEDVWDYYNDSKSGSFAPTLVSAKGRTSQAENPFIWIGTMASTAIAQNLKNRTKLSLYYFVANRADKQDLVSVRDVWYKYDQNATAEYQAQHPGSVKRIFTPAYPPVFTENLDSDSAKAAYDLWEEEMKKEEEKGNAYRGTQKMDVGDQVAFVSGREKPQHLITMKVRGRELALIINGNPRAAQAINGELNIEASKGYQKVFGPVLRFMSAVNTSYNPEFWISNAQRDILYAWMSTTVQGKSGKRFFKNLVSPKELMRMAREYKAGTLGDGKLETYYKEFAEGGGITGFTVISGNEVWEKKIQSYLEPKFFDKMKDSKFLEFFQDLGEAIEQMSRFSAYIAARDEGKSIADAVSDSKEITVNFNRKGSGKNLSFDEVKKLTRKNGRALTKAEQVGVLILSQIAPAGRSLYMFFNAGVQGCNNLYRLAKKNPKSFGVAVGAFFALGALQALVHSLIDDDDDYLDMPENMRRDNILLGADGVYFKWAMPQEMRSFYALGDIYVNKLMGRSPDTNAIWDTLRTLSEPLPITLNEGVAGLVPSYVRPLFELVTNKDYSGRSIYNGLQYLSEEERSRTPRYNQAYEDTSRLFIDMSHLMNVLTGGDEYTAGAVNIIPESIQHIVESYGGGLLTTLNKTSDFVSGLLNLIPGIDTGTELSARRTPFLNRVLVVSDDNIRNSYANRLYYYYKGEAEHTKKILRQAKKDGNMDAYRDIVHSKDFDIYRIYERYRKSVERYQDSIKDEDDSHERKLLMRQQDEIKKQMIRDISDL